MAKSKTNQLPADDEPLMDISSLIDVCFLLLIFFLVTSTIQPTERDLPMQLPTGMGPPKEDIVVSISLNEEGAVTLKSGGVVETLDSDTAERDLPKLENRLRLLKMAAEPNDVVVQLNVKDEAQQQRFIDVINCLAGEDITKLALTDSN